MVGAPKINAIIAPFHLRGKERGEGEIYTFFLTGPVLMEDALGVVFFDSVDGIKEQVCKRNVGLGWGGRETTRKRDGERGEEED